MIFFPLKPPARKRLYALISGGLLFAIGLYLILSALKDNMVFYYTPSEMLLKAPRASEKVRLGGMVKPQSLEHFEDHRIAFTATDFHQEIRVTYQGSLPDLFREGQGIVAEGYLQDSGNFQANTILAKHDESYRPPSINDEGYEGSNAFQPEGAQ